MFKLMPVAFAAVAIHLQIGTAFQVIRVVAMLLLHAVFTAKCGFVTRRHLFCFCRHITWTRVVTR